MCSMCPWLPYVCWNAGFYEYFHWHYLFFHGYWPKLYARKVDSDEMLNRVDILERKKLARNTYIFALVWRLCPVAAGRLKDMHAINVAFGYAVLVMPFRLRKSLPLVLDILAGDPCDARGRCLPESRMCLINWCNINPNNRLWNQWLYTFFII